jgi:ubiquinone/menaquinone biosynthesis C-methylase UbiE
MEIEKLRVREFWEEASCGEELYLNERTKDNYADQARIRYELEPYIKDFAGFRSAAGKRVLEIGVGLGADHQRFAEAGADLTGIDLTPRAVEHTTRRLAAFGLKSDVRVMDAEHLEFPDGTFDVVYSWGVLHHSPDTPTAVREVYRVLKPGGEARVMIYHKYSLVGYMLWVRYALMRFRPFTSLATVYSKYLESPGTKAYSTRAARDLFRDYRDVKTRVELTHGDLLSSAAGQRHRGTLLSIARRVWPRRFIRNFAPSQGLFLLISATR